MTHNLRLSVFCLCMIICQLGSTLMLGGAYSLPREQHSELSKRNPADREVWLYQNVLPVPYQTKTGQTQFPEHSYLWIMATPRDPAWRIEIKFESSMSTPYASVLEQTAQPGGLGRPGYSEKRKAWLLGSTQLGNERFLDCEAERGIILDALYKDARYRSGSANAGKLNACHHFVERIVTDGLGLGSAIPQEARNLWAEWDKKTMIDAKMTMPMRTTRYENAVTRKRLGVVETPFQLCKAQKPGWKRKRQDDCSEQSKGDTRKSGDTKPGYTEAGLAPNADKLSIEELTGVDDTTGGREVPAKVINDKASKLSLVRAGGNLARFSTVSKAALDVLGVAGIAIGCAFVIIDFVDHHWVGGAIGAIGLAAGVAAGFAVSGPLGWAVGGVIMALFAILPGLFQKQHPPADRTDVQGIIQWRLFGDKSHTGNEQCQKGTKDTPGNKDCQALYGPGTLSMALGMNNFDAIVFLQHFNDGYAMTIKDMAKSFYVADENKKGDGDDKAAVIRCHNNPGVLAGKADVWLGADDPKACNDPKFIINRKNIILPNINETADKIFDRIIPAPNGDCKLVAYPGDQVFPKYGLRINGLPSAIACGLTAAINVNGVAVPINADTKQNAQLGSDASQATDSQGGAYVDPPPKAPFKPLDPKKFACIRKKSEAPFCLPPGKYRRQSGVGFEIRDVDGLTLPSGDWTFITHWSSSNINHHDPKPIISDRTYRQNQYFDKGSQELENYKADMRQINANYKDDAWFRVTAPDDGPEPVCCLFSLPNFNGNVWCAGVGGGEVLPQWKNKAQSVSCHAGANVWLYADSYGDIGGALVKGDVTDLSSQPYGNGKGTFSKNVKAMWILRPE